MAYIKALMFLARQGMLGVILFGISLAIVFVGYKIEVICLSKAKRLAIVILTISLICWLYGELRALGVIIYPDDRQYFLHGLEHENHGYTLSFIFASYSIGSVIGFCRAKSKAN